MRRKISVFFRIQTAIIEEQVFMRVQELRANKRRPAKLNLLLYGCVANETHPFF